MLLEMLGKYISISTPVSTVQGSGSVYSGRPCRERTEERGAKGTDSDSFRGSEERGLLMLGPSSLSTAVIFMAATFHLPGQDSTKMLNYGGN